MTTKAKTKAQRRRDKKARRQDAPPGIPPLAETPKREPNGQRKRDHAGSRADALALKARCRQRGLPETAQNMREMRGQLWGCHAGRCVGEYVATDRERAHLWDAIQHMRRVQAAFDRAIGAPNRHAQCLRLLVPLEEMRADADTPPADERTDEEKQRQAIAGMMAVEGWLGFVDVAVMGEAKRVVIDDQPVRDPVGLLAALRCVSEGMRGERVTYRGRGAT